MKTITLAVQTLFADLEQRTHDADFTEQFDPHARTLGTEKGSFKKMKRHNKFYWYWSRREARTVTNKYVGPVTDKQISDRVAKFQDLKNDFDQRRQIVRSLIAAGLLATDYVSGEVVAALCRAGFFRLRGVLIGTTAYQCYSGVLGVVLPNAAIRTQDADFAQFFAIANMIDDAIPSILDVLRNVDPTFGPVPHITGGLAATAFANRDRYKVEFLTPNRGSDDYTGKPAPMGALGGASAEPLRFLDFLIRNPIKSVVLHEAAVPVTIPTPERYAIHKLIVSERRHADSSKIDKDVIQVASLIDAMHVKRAVDLSAAWQEAWERGPAWRQELTNGLARLDADSALKLEAAVKSGAAKRRKPANWPE
jgi:hypothetical protein